jgi:hypothetical protein
MASEGTNKGILIAVVVVAIVVWFLFNKAQSTVANVNKNIKGTYTTGTSVNAVVTNVAPALGSFLSSLARGGSSSSSHASSTPGLDTSAEGHSISYGSGDDSAAFSDDTSDYSEDVA